MALIKLLIVDDHPVFRQGLRDVFATDSEIDVVGEAADSQEALEKAGALRPDVILMDINLPGSSGLQMPVWSLLPDMMNQNKSFILYELVQLLSVQKICLRNHLFARSTPCTRERLLSSNRS